MIIMLSNLSFADQAIWMDTKEKYSFNLNVTAPKEFWNCDIAPDGTGGWDNCTAYLRVKNDGNAINAVETAIIWDKPSMVNNTKMYRTNTFNLFVKKINETIFNATKGNYSVIWNNQTYLNATNFVQYDPANTNIGRREELIVKMTMQRKSWKPERSYGLFRTSLRRMSQ